VRRVSADPSLSAFFMPPSSESTPQGPSAARVLLHKDLGLLNKYLPPRAEFVGWGFTPIPGALHLLESPLANVRSA